MKKQIGIMFIFGIFLLGIPCITFLHSRGEVGEMNNSIVKILHTENDKIEEVSIEDYIIGAVLSQMPQDFEEEALKAQAVLAHTYIERRKMTEKESSDESLKGADISDDTTKYQSYFNKSQAKKFYGDKYNQAYKRVKNAVKQVKNITLTYDSMPIVVAFHALSSGRTESAKNLWGEGLPYLISVDSSVDKEIDSFEKTETFSLSDIKKTLEKSFKNMDFSKLEDNLKIEKITDNSTVLTVMAGENEISGTDFSNALSLSSPCFSIDKKDDEFIFTTKGYGHLVGMSQYGANAMAKDGKDYKEILAHYFPKTQLKGD